MSLPLLLISPSYIFIFLLEFGGKQEISKFLHHNLRPNCVKAHKSKHGFLENSQSRVLTPLRTGLKGLQRKSGEAQKDSVKTGHMNRERVKFREKKKRKAFIFEFIFDFSLV